MGPRLGRHESTQVLRVTYLMFGEGGPARNQALEFDRLRKGSAAGVL